MSQVKPLCPPPTWGPRCPGAGAALAGSGRATRALGLWPQREPGRSPACSARAAGTPGVGCLGGAVHAHAAPFLSLHGTCVGLQPGCRGGGVWTGRLTRAPERRPGAGPHVPSACCRPAFTGCPGKLLRSTCSPAAGALTKLGAAGQLEVTRGPMQEKTQKVTVQPLGNDTTPDRLSRGLTLTRGLRAFPQLSGSACETHPRWDAGTLGQAGRGWGGGGRYSPGAE